MEWTLYITFICIAISIINIAIVLKLQKKNKDRKKNDKVILDKMKKILKLK